MLYYSVIIVIYRFSPLIVLMPRTWSMHFYILLASVKFFFQYIFNASSKTAKNMPQQTLYLLIVVCCHLALNQAKAPQFSDLAWTRYNMVVKGEAVMQLDV